MSNYLGHKRRRSDESDIDMNDDNDHGGGYQSARTSPLPTSLPPSSPPEPFSDIDDEDVDDLLGEEDEGEDLFADNMNNDYNENTNLDYYDEDNINDEEFDEMDASTRRAVEAKLARRDRREAGLTARDGSRRSKMPAFLQSDDEDDPDNRLLIQRRRRRHYDERPDMDDLTGEDDEIPLENLGDIKAASLNEWLNSDNVRRSVAKYFKNFIMTFTDEHGSSVYGQRIKTLGESMCNSFILKL